MSFSPNGKMLLSGKDCLLPTVISYNLVFTPWPLFPYIKYFIGNREIAFTVCFFEVHVFFFTFAVPRRPESKLLRETESQRIWSAHNLHIDIFWICERIDALSTPVFIFICPKEKFICYSKSERLFIDIRSECTTHVALRINQISEK